MLLGKNFDDINSDTIQSLIDASATESVHLDFKRESFGNADADKKEYLKDISSFANTLGGHLLIGVEEKEGVASRIRPLDDIDVDSELLRLENIARTAIEPAIVGVRMKRVDVDGGSVIVIHVPRSYNPPHRVIYKNSNRYYARHSAGAHELSLEELRMLFGQQRSVEERTKTFVGERFLRIQGNDGAMPIPVSEGVLVMHLVPIPDFGTNRRIEIQSLKEQYRSFEPIGATGFNRRINLDGLCVFRSGPVCHGYTQVFRDGSVEATSASMFVEREGRRFFPSLHFPLKLIEALSHYMKGLRMLEASPPIMLQISAIDVRDVEIGLDVFLLSENPPPFDRDILHLPPSLITEYRDDGNYAPIIAEQMDFLWNAFNFDRCSYFDADGNWIGK